MNKCYKYFRKHWKSIIFSLSILIFLAVMFLLLKDQITIFDNYVYNIIIKLKCKPVTYFFEIISFFCSTKKFKIQLNRVLVFNPFHYFNYGFKQR